MTGEDVMRQSKVERFLSGVRRKLRLDLLPATARRLLVGVVGGTVFLIGLALLVLPGPAFVVIPLGLALLATEFAWARRMLHRFRQTGDAAYRRLGSLWRGPKCRSSTSETLSGRPKA